MARSALCSLNVLPDQALETWPQPGFLTHAAALADLNLLAYVLMQSTRPREAWLVFEAISAVATSWPWELDGDPLQQIQEEHRRAFRRIWTHPAGRRLSEEETVAVAECATDGLLDHWLADADSESSRLLGGVVLDPEVPTSRHRLDVGVLPFFEDERPLQGLAGFVDWRTSGFLSGLLGIGAFVIGAAVWQGARAPEAPRRQRLRRVAARVARGTVAFLIALGVLWAWYGFQYHAGPDGSDSFNRPLAAKLAELRSPVHRTVIGLLDGLHILPRSYLWGLVDTIRAGVEGRGQNGNLLWGVNVIGDPPWYLWPSYLVAKMPLGLLGLAAAGALALRRLTLTPVQRAALLAVLAMALFHFIALLGSQGTYAGIRHALPIVVALGILAGAASSLAWTTRSRAWAGVTVGAFALTFGTTIGEARLWEYHNVLAGGTEGAGYRFANEGVDLGQRAYEIAAFNDSVIAPSGEPLYALV